MCSLTMKLWFKAIYPDQEHLIFESNFSAIYKYNYTSGKVIYVCITVFFQGSNYSLLLSHSFTNEFMREIRAFWYLFPF
jgi:hypothetical protein